MILILVFILVISSHLTVIMDGLPYSKH